jgi:2-polyprenyl-3-methyl-5-hydroxy-6-metoxy-1,4-benzoquinol methylase
VIDPTWTEDELEHLDRCVVCGSDRLAPFHEDLRAHAEGPWRLDRCAGCSCALLNPRPTPAAIGKAYAGEYAPHQARAARPAPAGRYGSFHRAVTDAHLRRRWGYAQLPGGPALTAAAAAMPAARRAADRLVRFVPAPSPGARLLDVGCGSGTYLALMRELGWTVHGVELDPGAVRTAREAGLDVRQGAMDDLDPQLDGTFDVVTAGHVIEHTHDPVAALAAVRNVLRPGGRLWLGTPNLDSAGERLFGSRWRALDPPRHLVLFDRDALTFALHRAGFTHVRPVRPMASARWNFRESARVAGLGHRQAVRAGATAVNAASHVRPALADEMTVVAERA